ncbi:MAG: helix-turn-helix domain-containing protein [Chloroflexi bacterium]|nr:helix-turn-helix domain-containing protein [Chloroflexota bacterium]
MSQAFDEIQAGLLEAIAHASGEENQLVIHKAKPVDVRAIRKRAGLSQQQFCALFGLSLGTLRHWEQGDRAPEGPALVLLNVMDKNPRAVLDALAPD